MAYVYMIINNKTQKKYIGQTIQDIKTRWRVHVSKNSSCICLKRAFLKYGIENFTFKIIIICFDEDRFKYETEYIKNNNSVTPFGYNISSGGESGFHNCIHSDKTKKTLSIASRLYWKNVENTENHRTLMSNIMKNCNISSKMLNSDKWLKALEEKRIGGNKPIPLIQYDENYNVIRKYSSIYEAHTLNNFNKTALTKAIKNNKIYRNCYWKINKNNSDTDNNNINNNYVNKNNRKIIQYDLCGVKISEHSSIKNASKVVGCSDSMITSHLKGKYKTAAGYIWKYFEDEKSENEIITEICKNNKSNKRTKMISQYDMNDNKIQDFNSINEACKACNITKKSIGLCINGHRESSKGYKWKLQN